MSTTTSASALTVQFINENIGKEITWHCFGDRSNLPYKGICKLLGIKDNKVVAETIKGSDLSFGRVEDGLITYSDSGRVVRIGSAFDIYTLKTEGGERDFMVLNGYDAQDIAKSLTTSQFELIHCI
jgi:hypothetical protein